MSFEPAIPKALPQDVRRYLNNLQDEVDGAFLYEQLANAESVPHRREAFAALAKAERAHAAVWFDKIALAGKSIAMPGPSLKSRVLARAAQLFGPEFVLPAVASAEVADRFKYDQQADAVSAGMARDERGHAAVLRSLTTAPTNSGHTGLTGPTIARAEGWHSSASGNNLRAAVLGANDGLVSNFCLLMGVAGGGASAQAIVLTGIAGLFAGACSMALGEWLSVTNAREMAQSLIAREAEELSENPEAEREELELIYRAKGLTNADAKALSFQMMRDGDLALETLARKELGIDPNELGGNPWSAAGVSFCLFTIGALLPLIPFLFTTGSNALFWCVLASALGLLALGVVTSLFNGRSAFFSGVRQVLVGSAAAAVTFGVGRLFGTVLS